jgi:hypothetical protein
MFVEDKNAMGLEVIIAGESVAGEEVVHGFVKLKAQRRALMIKQKEYTCIVFLPETHLNSVGHFQEGMEIAHLTQPGDQVAIKMGMTLGTDVYGLPQTVIVESHRRAASIELFGESGQDLAFLWGDNVTPQSGWMEMTGGERAFKSEMIFFTGRHLIEFKDLQTEEVSQIMRIAAIRRDIVFVDQTGIEGGD